LKLVSLFSGAGGLDKGFEIAGFDVELANEFDKKIWATYEANFTNTRLVKKSIVDLDKDTADIDFDVDGFIGGPPCQSWSEAGASRGIDDDRGKLFFEYLRLVEKKRPLFFLAENVSGILFSKHNSALDEILGKFSRLGYNVSYGLLNASDYGVPQDRQRVIIVGYQSHLGKFFAPPAPSIGDKPTLKDAIWGLKDAAVPAVGNTYANPQLEVKNHEYLVMGFSPIYMSRNRVRAWDEPSFTIQAGARHAPMHPQAPKMIKIDKDSFGFSPGSEDLYRRLTVREAACVQTFPMDHEFIYDNVADGYKMIGNAVPVEFAKRLAEKIKHDLEGATKHRAPLQAGKIKHFSELQKESGEASGRSSC
jgi:DNA (cytosine-5)-methyltransferase 1